MRFSISRVDVSDTRRNNVPRLSADISSSALSDWRKAAPPRANSWIFPPTSMSDDLSIPADLSGLVMFMVTPPVSPA